MSWADRSRLRRLEPEQQFSAGLQRPMEPRKKDLDLINFEQPGVYFRYNIRSNALYKHALDKHPSAIEDSSVYYENPVLAYYTDCNNEIPKNWMGQKRVVEKRLNPVRENVANYYMKFVDFLKEAIATQKCKKIYLPFSAAMAHQFEIPQIVYVNAETRKCGRVSQGRWWFLDHRKISTLAVLANDSTLYDEACEDSTEYTSTLEFLDLARQSPEVVVVCVIRRGWGEGDIVPGILVDPRGGADDGEEISDILSDTATEEEIMIFDDTLPEAEKKAQIVPVKSDGVRVSALAGDTMRFNITQDHEWGKNSLEHKVEKLVEAGKLTEQKGEILRAFNEQVFLADDYFSLLGERIEFCKNNFSILNQLKNKYDVWLQYTQTLMQERDPDILIRDRNHGLETAEVLASLCKQMASLAYDQSDRVIELAAVLAPQLVHFFCVKLYQQQEQAKTTQKMAPTTGPAFEALVCNLARTFFFDELQLHAYNLLMDLQNASNWKALLPIVAGHVAEKLGVYVLCTFNLAAGQDPVANRWAWRRDAGEKLMVNLREAVPNVLYPDRDNHVLSAFEPLFFRFLRNDPIAGYEVPKMRRYGEFLATLLTHDGFLLRQWGYQKGKEYKTRAKMNEVYKQVVTEVKLRIERAMLMGKLKDKEVEDCWTEAFENLDATMNNTFVEFAVTDGYEPNSFRSYFLELMAEQERSILEEEHKDHDWAKEKRKELFQTLLSCVDKREREIVEEQGANTVSKPKTARALLYTNSASYNSNSRELQSLRNLAALFLPLLGDHTRLLSKLERAVGSAKTRSDEIGAMDLTKELQQARNEKYFTVSAFARYFAVFLQLKCVPGKHKRDVLEEENDKAEALAESVVNTQFGNLVSEVLSHAPGDTEHLDGGIMHFLDMLAVTCIEEMKYSHLLRELLNETRERCLEFFYQADVDLVAKKYTVPGFQVSSMGDCPRELFIVCAVMLTYCAQQNTETQFQTTKQTLDVLADHMNTFLLDIVWQNNKELVHSGDVIQRALSDVFQQITSMNNVGNSGYAVNNNQVGNKSSGMNGAEGSRSNAFMYGNRVSATPSVVLQSYEQAMGLVRTSLKKEMPMMDHFFKTCNVNQLKASEISLADREAAVITALTIGTVNRLESKVSLPEIVEWVHLNAARSTNDVEHLLRQWSVHFMMNVDIFFPCDKLQRGEIVATLTGLLQNAKWNQLTSGDEREICAAEPIVAMEEVAEFLVRMSNEWRRKVSVAHFIDSDEIAEDGDLSHDERVLHFLKILATHHLGITHTMQTVVNNLYDLMRYPCVVSAEGEPLYILANNASSRQFQAFILLTKDFLFAEETGYLSQTATEACLVCLQNVGLKLAGSNVDLKCKWIHLIVMQELRRLGEDDFPDGFSVLANKITSLVAFLIPESVKGSTIEDPATIDKVADFVEKEEKFICDYMDFLFSAIEEDKAAGRGKAEFNLTETYEKYISDSAKDPSRWHFEYGQTVEDIRKLPSAWKVEQANATMDMTEGLSDRVRAIYPDISGPAYDPKTGKLRTEAALSTAVREFESAQTALTVAEKMAVPQEYVPLRSSAMAPEEFRDALNNQVDSKLAAAADGQKRPSQRQSQKPAGGLSMPSMPMGMEVDDYGAATSVSTGPGRIIDTRAILGHIVEKDADGNIIGGSQPSAKPRQIRPAPREAVPQSQTSDSGSSGASGRKPSQKSAAEKSGTSKSSSSSSSASKSASASAPSKSSTSGSGSGPGFGGKKSSSSASSTSKSSASDSS